MSHLRFNLSAAILGVLLLCVPGSACLWDYDTLKMERQRFPSTLELITGKFLRHTPEFYAWRIADRLQRIKDYPDDLAVYDDLAGAYDKTGQHDRAIEIMLTKAAKKSGVYETEANLGTFYIHAGQLEKGLEHIRDAIRINPNAHFGREKYQAYLVEYILLRRKDGSSLLPLKRADPEQKVQYRTFDAFLQGKQNNEPLDDSQRQAAIKGILGMMRFGKHDSPVLLEVLGNLLHKEAVFDDPKSDAKQLAARAYLKASYEVSDASAKSAYREMTRLTLVMQSEGRGVGRSLPVADLESDFQAELADAKQWYAEVQQNELAWIKEGKNPEKEFDRVYYQEPSIFGAPEPENSPPIAYKALAAGVLVLILVVFIGCRIRARKRQYSETLRRAEDARIEADST